MKKELSASEAIYAFAGWLTCRSEPVTIGSVHDAAIVADLADQFCKANKLESPRDEYQKLIVWP